jgi:hypothetical protein
MGSEFSIYANFYPNCLQKAKAKEDCCSRQSVGEVAAVIFADRSFKHRLAASVQSDRKRNSIF